MSLNDIKFNRNKNGLGAPLVSRDHVSGLLFYNDVLPSGFSATERVKKVFSLEQAESLGIVEGSADHAVEWYHIREFFEKNSKGELWIAIYDVPATPATHDFAELETVQVFADGDIRQMGVYFPHATLSAGLVTSMQAKVEDLQDIHMPLNVLFGPDISAFNDLSTLPDLRALSDNNISVCIGQDGANKGKALFDSEGKSITDLGSKLGAVSSANVNESIGWVGQFNMVTDGFELDTIAFANGQNYKDLSQNFINGIDNLGYIFLVKHVGISGTYNNDSYTATNVSSDLATIENNRTIDKAVRVVRTRVLPLLGSPLFVNPDGTLTEGTVGTFKSASDIALAQMESNSEISACHTKIDPTQDVLTTNEIVMTIEIVPVGVARSIVVNIGFVPNLSN